VPDSTPGPAHRVRTAELIAALSLATDLGTGLPLEHGLRSTLLAMRLAERLGVDADTASQTYYACLLFYIGCTADSEAAAEIFAGDLHGEYTPVMFGSRSELVRGLMRALAQPERPAPLRAVQIARRLPRAVRSQGGHLASICEVGEMLTERLGLPQSVQVLFAGFTERWDGKGLPAGTGGEDIPLPVRIVHVARDASFQRMLGGTEHAVAVVGERSGGAFDPAVVAELLDAPELLAQDTGASVWDATLAAEPGRQLSLTGDAIDRALAAIGDFADLISPSLAGHSSGVAGLAAAAAQRCGLADDGLVRVRRAGFVHDLGRVAVHPRIWQKAGALSADEWEQVRLHPYHGERVLSRSPFTARLADVAGAHHERVDGSGYHRGSSGATVGMPGRLLAAADAYHAMTEPRPHRASLSPATSAQRLAEDANAGRLDAHAVTAVLEAAGVDAPHIGLPAGLTEREAEALALLARGLQTKHVARSLGISVKTADRHVQNVYGKIGVSTRAGAALFAMEHGLTAWGELPMVRGAERA
jgi:HD-GYP domain-containing protein (c-di-GMP phosphodiesterase class II)/DNA-binding CsgD family transcriptional regulator